MILWTAIATYDEVVERFGDSDAPELQDLAAKVSFNNGLAQEQLGDPAAAIAAYDAVAERVDDSDAPELQDLAARALVQQGCEHKNSWAIQQRRLQPMTRWLGALTTVTRQSLQ